MPNGSGSLGRRSPSRNSGSPVSRINDRQNSDDGLHLRQAAQGAHRIAQRAATIAGVVALILMLLAIAATIFRPIAVLVAIVATVWAFLDFFCLEAIARRSNGAAAVIQEKLDTWLYDMKWEASIGSALPPEEINIWARKIDTPETKWRDWYPNLEGIPDLYAVLACQRVNLLWDLRLRRRYATALTLGVIFWTGLGVLIGLLVDLSVREVIVSWFVPSTPAFIRGLREAQAHREVVADKERLFEGVRAHLESVRTHEISSEERETLESEARRVQSCLYELRRRTERVPRRLYERYRAEDETDTSEAVADLRRRLNQADSA